MGNSPIRTNDLKKGDFVRLRCGWVAEIADNRRGNIRLAKVFGLYTELGSVYAHDIISKLESKDGPVIAVIAHSPKQKKTHRKVRQRGL